MKCLVTGGAGFIGTNLIKRLVSDGHKVVSLDNYSTGKKENEVDGCQYFEVDLSEVKYYSFFQDKPSVIFHLAALSRIQPSFDNPEQTFKSNVYSTVNIMEDARRNQIPVVYAGTSSVHGDKYINPYTFTKWQAEEIVKMYSELFDIPSCICRFYNVYGPGQTTEGAYCNVLGVFEKQYREGKPLTITSDGEQRRDFVHVEDIVDGMVKCMEAMHGVVDMRFSGWVFELGTGKNYSINEIAKAFSIITPMGGGEYPTKYIDAEPGEMKETLCTDGTANEILGWNPKGDIIEYIKEELVGE
jgi:UDP-glucose 4-epimerase